jgi:radical SAM protein with 4Fe4S-binding SPASM domain
MNFPHHAHIEPTTYCNLECENCINWTVPNYRLGHLSIGGLKGMLDIMPFIKDISLLGLGEPLMNPEILDMLELLKLKGIARRIATNGMLLDRIDTVRLLNSLDQCIISFDAASKEKFEEVRKGSDFERIVKNIKALVEIKNKNKIPVEIFFHTVITKNNLEDVLNIPEIAAELRIDKVRFVMAVQYTPKIPNPKSQISDQRLERELMNSLIDKCKRYNIGFSFTTSEKKFSTCWWPNGGVYVTYDGFVTPCCLRMDPSVYNFGNIFKDSIDVIFNGEKYQGFRRDFREGKVPDICSNCPI